MAEPTIADLARTLDKLITEMERHDDACPFTPDEIEQIKRSAQLVEWFDTAGWIGKRLLALITGIVLLISQWERLKEFFIGGGQ